MQGTSRSAGPAELCAAWLVHLEVQGKTLNTRKTYRAAVGAYLGFLSLHHVRYDSPAHQDLDRWLLHLLKTRKLTPRTVNGQISAVRNFYEWLRREGYAYHTAVEDLHMVRAPRLLPKPIAEKGIEAMIEASESAQERALAELLYATGLRVGELVALNVGDVDLEARTVRVLCKGGVERVVLFGGRAQEALRIHLAARPPAARPLWPGRFEGSRLAKKTVRVLLRGMAARAGVEGRMTPHRWRHSFATHLIDHGAGVEDVQELIGHANIQTTMIYTQVSREKARKAYERAHPRA